MLGVLFVTFVSAVYGVHCDLLLVVFGCVSFGGLQEQIFAKEMICGFKFGMVAICVWRQVYFFTG